MGAEIEFKKTVSVRSPAERGRPWDFSSPAAASTPFALWPTSRGSPRATWRRSTTLGRHRTSPRAFSPRSSRASCVPAALRDREAGAHEALEDLGEKARGDVLCLPDVVERRHVALGEPREVGHSANGVLAAAGELKSHERPLSAGDRTETVFLNSISAPMERQLPGATGRGQRSAPAARLLSGR